MSEQQIILFLGATGGVTNAVLTCALKSNAPAFRCVALVRTPQKLRDQLLTKQSLPATTIDSRLTIFQGNALNAADVKRVLLSQDRLPSMVITGVGGAPGLNFDWRHPLQIAKLDQPSICANAARTLAGALREIYSERPDLTTAKPAVAFVSTTGISRGPEDVPFAMRYFYHEMLALPHVDKRDMEQVFRDQNPDVFSSVTGIRPTLLGGEGVVGAGLGWQKLRAGVERKPELGYSVKREDVGEWVYEKVVKDAGKPQELGNGGWRGEMISLTS